MINNINQIKEILSFPSEDSFYHCQILKRKKEHPELRSNSMIVKTYYISSLDYLEKKMPEIIALCEFHNARGCINLNRRSFEQIAFQTLRKVADQILNKDFKSVRKAYESVCGVHSNEQEKKWIIDIDSHDQGVGNEISEIIKSIGPNPGESKLISILQTKNGYHLITKPFNIAQARTFWQLASIDIHKDNPTILFIP